MFFSNRGSISHHWVWQRSGIICTIILEARCELKFHVCPENCKKINSHVNGGAPVGTKVLAFPKRQVPQGSSRAWFPATRGVCTTVLESSFVCYNSFEHGKTSFNVHWQVKLLKVDLILPTTTSRDQTMVLPAIRPTALRSLRTSIRPFSIAARRMAEGDTGGMRRGGERSADTWTRREKAAEDMYIKEREKEIVLLLKEKIAKQKEQLAKDQAVLSAMEDQYGHAAEDRTV